GNVIVSKPRLSEYNSGRFIQFGQNSGGQHNGTLFAVNNTFIAGDGRIQFLSANAPGAGLLAVNNIFYGSHQMVGTIGSGISGSNNWVQSSAAVPTAQFSAVAGNDPGFISRAARNFRLTAASACRDQGAMTLTYLDGTGSARSGSPVFE